MPPSFSLETTLVPLTLLILLGWIVGRVQDIDLKSVSTMLIYAISPVVAFGSTAQLNFHGNYVLLPFITFILASFCGLTSFALGRRLLKHKDMGYLLPQATGSGNNGYFGLPLAMAILSADQVGVYFLIMLGTSIFEATLGYYFVGRGHLTVRHALKRVVRMPVTYAIAGGLALSARHVTLDPGLLKLWEAARGSYVCIGMMIIGIALAKHKKLAWEIDFIALAMFGKYILWAVAVAAFAWTDIHVLKIYDAPIYTMIAILAITPVAANTAAFAAQHDFKPQLAATIVFITTIISFAFLPVVLPLIFTFAQR
jgi:predicted permease